MYFPYYLHPVENTNCMRKIFLCLGLLFALTSQAQTKKNVDSKIDKVTVFLQGAQVERSGKTSLAAGKYELVFGNISPMIDKQSIQVKAGDGITVLSVNHQQNFLKEQNKQEEIKSIETDKELLQDKIDAYKNTLHVFEQEEKLMVQNQHIGGSATTLKATELKDAADFQRIRLTEIYQKQAETNRIIRKMDEDMAKLNMQLAELNSLKDKTTSEIHVTVNAKETSNTLFSLTYLVKETGWYPTYDIRVKDISSPITLQYKANVHQQSGEDWKEVKLFLSNGNPSESGSKPVLNPWYLGYGYTYQPVSNSILGYQNARTISGIITDETGSPLPGASVTLRLTRTGVSADNNGQFRILAKPGDVLVVTGAGLMSPEVQLGNISSITIPVKRNVITGAEVVVTALGNGDSWGNSGYSYSSPIKKKREETAPVTTTIYQPTTTIYEIKDPYTILNDGKMYMVDIDGYEVDAQYEYYAAPKLEPFAFLTAHITDWQELNLLSGEANLFFEGTFLGKSELNMTNAGDTLNISLGRDKGVTVQRKLLKEYSARKFMGSNKTDTRQYEILVRNNKAQPITMQIEDQLPVSTQKEIEIQNTKYPGASLDDDTKILTWKFTLESKKENKINFSYEVKYPRDKTLVLE